MLPKINPTETAAWKSLIEHQVEMKKVQMKDMFKKNPKRFEQMSIKFEDILFDYSKNIINEKTLEKLFELAEECKVRVAREAMFSGEKINQTENRAVMHTALRNFSDTPMTVDGKDIMPEIRDVRQKMKSFCEKIHSGEWKGYTGKAIKNIVKSLHKVDNVYVGSFLFQITKYLSSFIKDGEKIEGEVCSECGSTAIIYQEGCKKCSSCGNSKCG